MGIIHSTYYMDFPLKDGDAMIQPKDLGTRPRRILLIDDDAAVLDVTKRILESLGHHVTAASSSPGALNLFRNDPDLFDLVITDMSMPCMTGDDLARRMMEIRLGMPVILYSGMPDDITRERARKIGIRELAMKPLTMRDLDRIIRRALDGEEQGIRQVQDRGDC